MSVVKNLEALINLENNLKAQYEKELKVHTNKIDALTRGQENLQSTISDQLKKINELSAINTDTKRLEQTNRELNNRAEKLQGELETQKNRSKSIQKDLNEARAAIKVLEQYDAEKMKKNLVAAKETLAEQRIANDFLIKNSIKIKAENAELQQTLKELKEELEGLKATTEVEETTETEEMTNEVTTEAEAA
jgi:hypothetical protein